MIDPENPYTHLVINDQWCGPLYWWSVEDPTCDPPDEIWTPERDDAAFLAQQTLESWERLCLFAYLQWVRGDLRRAEWLEGTRFLPGRLDAITPTASIPITVPPPTPSPTGLPPSTRRRRGAGTLLERLRARHRCPIDAAAGFEQVSPRGRQHRRRWQCLGCGAEVTLRPRRY